MKPQVHNCQCNVCLSIMVNTFIPMYLSTKNVVGKKLFSKGCMYVLTTEQFLMFSVPIELVLQERTMF